MQNTQYENAVTATIENFANTIAEAAHDSVAENNDYGIYDSVQAIDFIMRNYANYNCVNSLAAAALRSTLDTAVRENIHARLTFIN